jgi:hypothetical protein
MAPVHRSALFLITILVAPPAIASATSRAAKVALYEAAWEPIRDPARGHACATCEFRDAMRPFVEAHETELVDWILRDGGVDRFDRRLRGGECADLCRSALQAAVEADPQQAAKLAYVEALRRREFPDIAYIIVIDTGSAWPVELLTQLFDAYVGTANSPQRKNRDALCARILDKIAPKSWDATQPRLEHLIRVARPGSNWIPGSVVSEAKPSVAAAHYLLDKSRAQPDPIKNPYFDAFLMFEVSLPEAEPQLLALAAWWLSREATLGPSLDDPYSGHDFHWLDWHLSRLGTPEAQAALAKLNSMNDRLSAKTTQLHWRNERRKRLVGVVPVLPFVGLGIAQLLVWRPPRRPGRARTVLVTINSGILIGPVVAALGGLVVFAVTATAGGGTHSFGHWGDGLQSVFAAATAAAIVGVLALGGGSYLGYRLRERRWFYLATAILQMAWPWLGLLA